MRVTCKVENIDCTDKKDRDIITGTNVYMYNVVLEVSNNIFT